MKAAQSGRLHFAQPIRRLPASLPDPVHEFRANPVSPYT